MEKTLRKKLIIITTLTTLIILLSISFIIKSVNTKHIEAIQSETIENIIENDGILVFDQVEITKIGEVNKRTIAFSDFYVSPYIAIKLNEEKQVLDVSGTYEVANVETFIDSVKDKEGYFSDFRYSVTKTDYGYLYVYLDISRDELIKDNISSAMAILVALTTILMFISSIAFSKRLVKPFVENNERQKEFITNVSHELKTPLSIIKTNTEVIELTSGKSDFTNGIHKSVERLDELVHTLITYNKYVEFSKIELDEINLSNILEQELDYFYLSYKEYLEVNIEKDIIIKANYELIDNLVSILLDNIIKHGTKDTLVKVNLYKTQKHIVLETINYAEGLEKKKYDELFNRFYKLDKSRTKKDNSFGIGLSLASEIVKYHNGKISASSADGESIIIRVKLKN